VDSLTQIVAGLDAMRPGLAEFYRDLHRNPELSMQENRTAAKAAERLRAAGYAVTTGVGNSLTYCAMDPRYAGALALVGCYLIFPPPTGG
jgi:metal-dependent amidase/aminoacylase/carboxypeptidase family protein